MKKIMYTALMFVTISSCDLRIRKGEDLSDVNYMEQKEILNHIKYIKDYNTGLCFATLNNKTHGFRNTFIIACVPCENIKEQLNQ